MQAQPAFGWAARRNQWGPGHLIHDRGPTPFAAFILSGAHAAAVQGARRVARATPRRRPPRDPASASARRITKPSRRAPVTAPERAARWVIAMAAPGDTRVAAAAAHFGRDLDRCLERVATVITAAHSVHAALLVLPAATLGGPPAPGDPIDLPPALPSDAPVFAEIARLAGSMVVCLGFCEWADGRRWSSAVCLNGDGVLGRQRQVHLTHDPVAAPGGELAAFDTPVGRLGMLLDRDKAFPEAARTLALDGAVTVASLSAWPASSTGATRLSQDRESKAFDVFDCARAAENQVAWVSANQTGALFSMRFLGQAKVVGPAGEVLARTWATAGLAVAPLDAAAEVARAREGGVLLDQRRPDVYPT